MTSLARTMGGFALGGLLLLGAESQADAAGMSFSPTAQRGLSGAVNAYNTVRETNSYGHHEGLPTGTTVRPAINGGLAVIQKSAGHERVYVFRDGGLKYVRHTTENGTKSYSGAALKSYLRQAHAGEWSGPVVVHDPQGSAKIEAHAAEMVAKANGPDKPLVVAKFNGVTLAARPGESVADVTARYGRGLVAQNRVAATAPAAATASPTAKTAAPKMARERLGNLELAQAMQTMTGQREVTSYVERFIGNHGQGALADIEAQIKANAGTLKQNGNAQLWANAVAAAKPLEPQLVAREDRMQSLRARIGQRLRHPIQSIRSYFASRREAKQGAAEE